MAGWLSRLFSGSDKRGRSERASASEGAERDGPSPFGRPRTAARDSRGGDTTVRIDAKTSSRLAWPARDENKPAARPEQPLREQAPAFDPHEEPTRLVGTRSAGSDPAEPDRRGAARSRSPDDPIISRRPSSATRPASPVAADEESEPADDTTRLVGSQAGEQEDDPVVGWLVVLKGPGRGRSLEIGSGANPIGRAPGQKLCLNFGDPQISRERHAIVVYDPVSRRFFLQAGAGRNLTYLGDQLVLEPKEMNPGDTITVGDTVLHFVPYCGADFGWS
jgi:hypothetical protein